jgi:MarR family transcriptional regulator, lower aerobic nicotinate degradation pathway regulator
VITNKPDRLTRLTTYLLSQTAKVAKGDLDDRLAAAGFRLRHMSVIDPSDVTATVDDLEKTGLATRSMDPADRRRKIVTLTASGSKRLEWMQQVAEQLCEELLAPVAERRRAQLHQDLRRVLLARDARDTNRHQEET